VVVAGAGALTAVTLVAHARRRRDRLAIMPASDPRIIRARRRETRRRIAAARAAAIDS